MTVLNVLSKASLIASDVLLGKMVVKRSNNRSQLNWSKCFKHWDRQSLHQHPWMCTVILNLLNCDDGKTTASTSTSFRDNTRYSLIQSKKHNFRCLISAYDKRECELLKGLSQKKGATPFFQTNEFSYKSMVNVESFSCLMLTITLKGNLVHCVMFLQIGLN